MTRRTAALDGNHAAWWAVSPSFRRVRANPADKIEEGTRRREPPTTNDLQDPNLLTLQPRQRVGHDILLARHGNHISSMRLDRSNDRVVAVLADGTTDSAPNLISPLLEMPETLRSVLRSDWRALVMGSAMMLAIGLLAGAVAIGLLGNMSEEQLAQLAYTSSVY